jgi:hypothetical protein
MNMLHVFPVCKGLFARQLCPPGIVYARKPQPGTRRSRSILLDICLNVHRCLTTGPLGATLRQRQKSYYESRDVRRGWSLLVPDESIRKDVEEEIVQNIMSEDVDEQFAVRTPKTNGHSLEPSWSILAIALHRTSGLLLICLKTAD